MAAHNRSLILSTTSLNLTTKGTIWPIQKKYNILLFNHCQGLFKSPEDLISNNDRIAMHYSIRINCFLPHQMEAFAFQGIQYYCIRFESLIYIFKQKLKRTYALTHLRTYAHWSRIKPSRSESPKIKIVIS